MGRKSNYQRGFRWGKDWKIIIRQNKKDRDLPYWRRLMKRDISPTKSGKSSFWYGFIQAFKGD